jgi:hypothetical protein
MAHRGLGAHEGDRRPRGNIANFLRSFAMGRCKEATYHSATGTTFAALLSDAVEAEYDLQRAEEDARKAVEARTRAASDYGTTRVAVRDVIEATASRTGHQADEIALRGGDYVAVLVGRAVKTYRVIDTDAPACPCHDPLQETADILGHRLYSAGCSPEEAGVPADDAVGFEFALNDVTSLGPLAEPLVAHPLGNGRPAVADAACDLVADEDGFVPASALGAMRSAAASQTWGASSNAIG